MVVADGQEPRTPKVLIEPSPHDARTDVSARSGRRLTAAALVGSPIVPPLESHGGEGPCIA